MASNRVDPNNTKKSKLNDNIDEDESGEQDDSEIIDMIDMNFSDLNSNYNRPNNDNVSERQNTVRDQTNTQHDQTFETPTPKKTTVYTLASENLFRKFITQKEKTSIYQVLFDDDRLISKYNRPNSVILADKNKNFLQRNKEFMINKTQKLLRKSRERELQEKQTLRDKPAVITTMEDRKFEEQFKDKLKHLRMKENNIKLRRQKDMEEMKKKCTFKPQIDNGSKIIVGQIIERNNSKARQGQGTKYEDVYNRLFNGKNGNRSEILLNDRNYSTTKNRNTIGSKSEERKNPIAMDFTTYLNLKQKPSSPNHYEYIKPRVFDYQYYLQNRGNKNPSKNSRGNLSTRNVKNQRKLESPSKNITSTSPMSKYRIETDIEQGNLKLANKKSNVIVLQKFLNEFELGLPGHDVTITEFNDLMYKLGFTIYDQNKHFDTTTRNIKTEKQMLSKAYEYINKLKIDTCSINETFLMFCLIVQGFYFSIDYLIAHRNSKLPNKSESNDVNFEVVKSQWENRKHEESDDEEEDKKCDNNEEPIKETNESEDSKNQTEDFEFAKKKYSSDFYALETYLNYLKRHILKVNCKCFNPKLALEIKLTFRQFNSNRKRHLEIIFKEKRDIKVKNIDMTYSTSQVNFNSRFSNSRIDKSNELYQQLSNNNQSSNYATRSRINLISHNKYSSSAKKER